MPYNNLCCIAPCMLRHAICVCHSFGSSLIAFRAVALTTRLQCCSTCRSFTVLYSTCNFAMAVCKTYSYCMIEVAPDYLNTLWASAGQIKYQSAGHTTDWHGSFTKAPLFPPRQLQHDRAQVPLLGQAEEVAEHHCGGDLPRSIPGQGLQVPAYRDAGTGHVLLDPQRNIF